MSETNVSNLDTLSLEQVCGECIHNKGACKGLNDGCQTSRIPFLHSNNRLDNVLINFNKGNSPPSQHGPSTLGIWGAWQLRTRCLSISLLPLLRSIFNKDSQIKKECRMATKFWHATRGASNVHSAASSRSLHFHKMQLGRGGKCKACKGGGRKRNQNPQQPLIGMILTNLKSAGGDTVVTMERVREAIAFNLELVDKSTWLWANLWLTSEQMGFPLRPTGGGRARGESRKLRVDLNPRNWCIILHSEQMPNIWAN